MFEGFHHRTLSGIHLVEGGKGPPLLLLHGFPETCVAWRKVAPVLADQFRVIAADLRGYGDSHKPAAGPGYTAYSKREMAREMVSVMAELGFGAFRVAGHDRGARVACRMALDYPEKIDRLVLIDILPAREMLARPRQILASGYLHWFFFRLPRPWPERFLGLWTETFLRLTYHFQAHGAVESEALREYLRCYRRPGALAAALDDFRATFSIDRVDDRGDTGRRLSSPVLVLYGTKSPLATHFDMAGIWKNYATDLECRGVPGGHFLPEESPGAVADRIREFLSESISLHNLKPRRNRHTP